MNDYRYLTLQQVSELPQHQPIYVINTSHKTVLRTSGDIHIGVPKLNGSKIDPLHVRKTWIPQDVTAFIPKEQLLGSSEFRQALNRGLITIISQQYADELMADDGYQSERNRLDEFDRMIANFGASRTLTNGSIEMAKSEQTENGSILMAGNQSEGHEAAGIVMASAAQTGGTEILDFNARTSVDVSSSEFSPGFNALLNKIQDLDDLGILNALRNHQKFRRAELQHLLKVHSDKPKTTDAISNLLNK